MSFSRWISAGAGVLIGVCVATVIPSWAYRTEQPPTFTNIQDTNQLSQLNNILLQLWNVANGLYASDVVTADPDGIRTGDAGQGLMWMNGSAANFCMNTNNATDWDCVSLAD